MACPQDEIKDCPSLDAIFPEGLAGIVFDCDGVMIDSLLANRYFYNTILAALGLPPMTPEQEQYAFMATARQALLNMTPEKYHDKLDDICRENINYKRDVLPRTRLMPGFIDFIREAHDLGLRLGIDTNRTVEGIQRVLDFFSLPKYFDPVISATCHAPKPAPDGLLMICGQWKVEPAQTLFVGDSEIDRRAAIAAGARFAAFGGHVPGDVPASDYSTLGRCLWPFVKTHTCPEKRHKEQA